MSHGTKFTIPVDWVVDTSELGRELYVDFKLGNVFNDFWSLMLFKKQNKKTCNIILSMERKRGEQRVMANIKLTFTDLYSNRSSEAKYVKKFQHVDIRKASYFLNKDIRQIFLRSERIRVTGEVFFHLIPNSGPVASPQTLTTLSTDFKKICCSDIFSDLILRCGSEIFTAHKNILAIRCPVFDEMLENNEGKIDIKDLEPHVLKAVLLFIYSGETDLLTFQSACDLLSAANKYRLNELKTLCVNHITSSFTIENVLDYFHQYEVAKTYALEFISENILEIKQTKQWLNFKREFPGLVSKLGATSEINGAKQEEGIKQERTGTSKQCTENNQHYSMNSNRHKDIKQECPGTSKQCAENKRNYSTSSNQQKDINQGLGTSSQCTENERYYSLTSEHWKDIAGDNSGSSEQSKSIKEEDLGISSHRKGIKREFSGTTRQWAEQKLDTWF